MAASSSFAIRAGEGKGEGTGEGIDGKWVKLEVKFYVKFAWPSLLSITILGRLDSSFFGLNLSFAVVPFVTSFVSVVYTPNKI